MEKKKRQKGITLIALVITIIVLLILAGISIASLTGEKGILGKAQTAGEKTKEVGAKEKVQVAVMGSYGEDGKLNNSELKVNLDKVDGIKNVPDSIVDFPITVEVDGYIIKIKENAEIVIEGKNSTTATLPVTSDTKPFLPEGASVDEEHNTLEKGLVIKDTKNNEWVWIEVPKSIYTNTSYNGGIEPKTSQDYEKIESILQAYAKNYRTTCKDVFYSTEQHGFANSTEYDNWKNSMLKSVYENGGFYIGRYEVGTDTERFSTSDTLTTPLIQRDKYPYHYVTCRQAQSLAKQLTTEGKQASLMFGIQWDLVLRYIEEKGAKTKKELKEDSTSWGNYYNATFSINRGKYKIGGNTENPWKEISNNYTKETSSQVLLTTGATNRNSVLGIYDLAGNVFEWTLEYTNNTTHPCVSRGGAFNNSSELSAIGRGYAILSGDFFTAFRITLW